MEGPRCWCHHGGGWFPVLIGLICRRKHPSIQPTSYLSSWSKSSDTDHCFMCRFTLLYVFCSTEASFSSGVEVREGGPSPGTEGFKFKSMTPPAGSSFVPPLCRGEEDPCTPSVRGSNECWILA